ncbi:MAG: hypothetical protein Q9185_000281 [Variospora sp. 1 TL-2023]
MAAFLSWLRVPFLASSGLAALGSGLLYWKQNELIYPRNLPFGARTEEGVPRPNQFGISDYEDLRFPTPDGETLNAFFIRPSNKRQARKLTVLMFHGNAGNIGHRVPIAKVLEEYIGCNVFMLEYRGYGLSTGTPDEDGINIDAQTAIDYIRNFEETRNDKIIVYGESIGGACAIRLVANNQDAGDIAGLILINTFTSIRKLIPSAFPPAKYIAGLCHQYWNSEEALPQITKIPIIFMSGLRDEIVPPSHMKQLYSICKVEKKIWREFPNGSHNDTIAEPGFFDRIVEFVRDLLAQQTNLAADLRGNNRRPYRGAPSRRFQNHSHGPRPPPIPGEPPNNPVASSQDLSLALRPSPVAPSSPPSSAAHPSVENLAAEVPGDNNSRGGPNRFRRGMRGERRGGGVRGRDTHASHPSNANARQFTGNVTGSTSVTRLPTGRQFGGQLTTPVEPTDPSSNSTHTMSADAPEFRPGHPHRPRPKGSQNVRKAPAAQHTYSQRHRRDSGLKSTAPDIATRTHEDIANSLYECPICTSDVGRNSKVWSCKTCWTAFHLACIKKWAANEGSTLSQQRDQDREPPPPRQWRCPGCNLPKDDVPIHYTCWCEKEFDPRFISGIPPHSCGQSCGKSRILPKNPAMKAYAVAVKFS